MAKKIRVEFEFSPEEVKELVESGTKGPKILSDTELEKLSKKGVIRAADYLDLKQLGKVKKRVAKIPHKYSKAAYGPNYTDKIDKVGPKVEQKRSERTAKKMFEPTAKKKAGAESGDEDFPKE